MTAAAFPPFVTPAGTGLRQHVQAADPQGRRPGHSQDPAGGRILSDGLEGCGNRRPGQVSGADSSVRPSRSPRSCATPSSVSSPQT